MKREKIDISIEGKILTHMITNPEFLRELSPVFRPELLKTDYARQVSEWVVEYYKQFKVNPGKDIQSLYEIKKQTIHDGELADNIAEFLSTISKAHEIHNVEFEFKKALDYLKVRSLVLLKEKLELAENTGDHLTGEKAVAEFKRVEKPEGEGVSLYSNPGGVAKAFMEDEEILFRVPGAFGRVVGDIHRGDFISILAPMKRGKSWFLDYLGDIGAHNGCKVIHFTLEMTINQVTRRAWQSVVGAPKEAMEVRIPFFDEQGTDKFKIDSKTEFREPVNVSKIKAIQRLMRRRIRRGEKRLESFPSYSVSVEDLSAHLDNLYYYENFVPDVIIIDYADIVKPSRQMEYRHGLDDVWKKLRRMAQERMAVVITATQAEKSSFNGDMKETHVAEDIRKLAHVTCMVALNQSKEEKAKGVMRASQLAIREGSPVFDQAVILQCLEIGRPVIDSKFMADVIIDKPELEDEESGEDEQEYKGKSRWKK